MFRDLLTKCNHKAQLSQWFMHGPLSMPDASGVSALKSIQIIRTRHSIIVLRSQLIETINSKYCMS